MPRISPQIYISLQILPATPRAHPGARAPPPLRRAPTAITIACGFSAATFAKYDLSALHWLWSAGAELAEDVRGRAEERFGCEIIRGYGMTESTGPVSCSRAGFPGYQVIPGVQLTVRGRGRARGFGYQWVVHVSSEP